MGRLAQTLGLTFPSPAKARMRKIPSSRKAIQLPTGPLESIPKAGRAYVKGFRKYDASMQSIRAFIEPIALCQHIVHYLNELDDATSSARRQLANCINLGRFDDIEELMLEEGLSLENFLQARPSIDLLELEEDNKLTPEIDEFFERFMEATYAPAFDLAAYLVGSDF